MENESVRGEGATPGLDQSRSASFLPLTWGSPVTSRECRSELLCKPLKSMISKVSISSIQQADCSIWRVGSHLQKSLVVITAL